MLCDHIYIYIYNCFHELFKFEFNFKLFRIFLEKLRLKFNPNQIRITKTQLGVSATRIKDFERKVIAEFKKGKLEQISWLDKIEPKLDQWLTTLFVVNIICDPVTRLLSDFTHVTDEHNKEKSELE
jgi:hypothetical protein